jgi:4-amino-4-deoxy-L-arabinose transferase-like glycosyltransferase
MPSSALAPIYSPGLPLMMAAFQKVGGRDAVFYVVPLLGALAVWSTFLLGRQVAGPWAGALAALFMVSSPPFLWFVIQPMSDVAVTAWWTVALLFAWKRTRASALLAGAATAAAVLVRPNLAPLAIMVGLMAAINGRFDLRRLLLVLVAAAPGALAVAVLNWYWHGSMLRSGYGPLAQMYGTDHVWPNLQSYFAFLVDCQTPLVFLGFAAPFLLWRRTQARLPLAILFLGFPIAVLAAYVGWVVVDSWDFLRFLLPAFPVMFVGMGAALMTGIERFHRSALAVGMAAALTALVVFNGWNFVQRWGLFEYAQLEERYVRAVDYANGLAPEAVLVSLTYSGTLSFYTGRSVLVWEVLGTDDLDPALAYLRARGHSLYFIGDGFEVDYFKRKFAGTRAVETLDAGFIKGDAGFVVYDMTLY